MVPLQPLSGALTPVILLPGLRGFSFSADAIHTAGWHNAGGGGEGAGLPDEGAEAKAATSVDPTVICGALEKAAALHDLPLLFFTRLIWQESRFKPNAVSRAGAQGVAQFMPRVAAEMGLEDPFDPVQALPVSARLLSQLYERFGNWGLAAAAYNGGPRRVREWLARKGKLPKETRHYVQTVTGIPADRWAGSAPLNIEFKRPPRVPCDNLPPTEMHAAVGRIPLPPGRPEDSDIAEASAASTVPAARRKAAAAEAKPADKQRTKSQPAKPWAVLLAAHWSPKQALAAFERLRKKYPNVLAGRQPALVADRQLAAKKAARQRVQLAMETRADAERLCSRLKSAGGSCLVRKN